MPKPLRTFHKADRRTVIDKFLLAHIVLCLFFYFIYWYSGISVSIIRTMVMLYSIGLVYFFYFNHYKVLTNTKVYLTWLGVAIIQFLIYYKCRSRSDLMSNYGMILTPLRSLFVFLILYQILRQVSLYFNHKEPVMMSRNEFNLTSLEYAATLPIFIISLLSCFNF